MDLEVVVRDGGDGRISGAYRGSSLAKAGEASGATGSVTVVQQQCCVGPPPHSRSLQEVQLVVQKKWSYTADSGAPQRSRLLVPHTRLRFSDYYDAGKKLGEGSFGDVHEALARPVDPQTGRPLERAEGDVAGGSGGQLQGTMTSRRVAVKIFRLNTKPDVTPGKAKTQQPTRKHDNFKKNSSFEAERAMLASLEHPHIIRMYECFQESNALFIVLELCRGGELYSRLVARAREVGTGLDEPLSKHLFRQMLHAVGYLHVRSIVHRDIKTENFLLLGELDSPEGDTLKLCDFGTSTLLTPEHPRCMENIGTLSYTAPEVYMNKGAAVPSDGWSLGVVLYVMLTGTNPFRVPGKKVDREETVRRIRNCDFEKGRQSWIRLSDKAKELVQCCLVLEEDQRRTCKQALQHHWVETAVRPTPPVCTELALSGTGGASAAGGEAYAPKVVALLQRMPRLAVVQRLAVECCAVAASEADLQTNVPWRDIFIALDQDQDGCLSFKELSQGLVRMVGSAAQVQPQQLEECAQALDLDNSGKIEWIEWLVVALLSSKGISEVSEPLNTAFRLVDRTLEPAGDFSDVDQREEVGEAEPEYMPPSLGRAGDDGLADQSPFLLEDLRFVVASLEVHEIL